MREYFLGLILFAFFGSVIFSVAPSGLSKKYLRFLCGLCSVGCIIFPLASITLEDGTETVKELFEGAGRNEEMSAEIYNSNLDNVVLEGAEKDLKDKIISELNARHEDFDVNIILGENSGENYIISVLVTFYSSGCDINPREVEKICFSVLNCECEFYYDV